MIINNQFSRKCQQIQLEQEKQNQIPVPLWPHQQWVIYESIKMLQIQHYIQKIAVIVMMGFVQSVVVHNPICSISSGYNINISIWNCL